MKTALKWIASLALLGAGLYLLDWPSLVTAAAKLTPWAFAAAVLLAAIPMLPLLVRWHTLTGGVDGWYLCGARYLYANLLNTVSPGSLGGDVYRFFAFRTAERTGAALLAILIRERLLGLTSMLIGLLIGVAALEFAGTYTGQSLARTLGVAAAVGFAGLFLLPVLLRLVPIPEPWRAHLQAALSVSAASRAVPLLAWSLLALALWVVAVQFVAVRLGLEIPWPLLLVVVTSVELVRTIPFTVQGIGLREGAFASLLGTFGYAPESGFVLGAAAYLALGVALVVTGAIGAVMLGRRETAV
ncbi:MAG TPA: lysylphosphatidylglycerol synthase domain-containing protein [Burkholderiales bacterium]|nr:lysylphosphatidylglycerol synthase domain-containing protein [Burkholderiales bacterium]